MATRDLLFELGTEELPPKALRTLMEALKEETASRLRQAGLEYAYIQAYATPRRLTLLVHELTESQPDKIVERRGPAIQAAFDTAGNPTQAALGFAKSCGVTVDALETLSNAKGEWLLCRLQKKGARTPEILPDILRQALATLPIHKRMRWGAGEAEFVRPVHWVVLLFGDEVIDVEILGVRASNTSRGHRFHCRRPVTFAAPDHYAQTLMTDGRVIADFEERRNHIRQQALKLASQAGGMAHIEDGLLDEVTALVEWPVGLLGSFERRFLELPKEVLITVMQSHQKYFPVLDQEGGLLPHFIATANLDSHRPETVRTGNERVIRPRLADAEFFWNQDLKTPLEKHLDRLGGIIFQKTLGTLLDKTRRLESLAGILAPLLDGDPDKARRAAHLSKTDLVTDMVGEFPELQGTMGRYYALAQGEHPEVAAALEEQYRPRQAGGRLPETRTGDLLSLADKTDTLIGIFSIGQIPSGTKDPYALRRAALGIIRILLEKELDLNLPDLLQQSADLYTHAFDHHAVTGQVYEFILERLRGYLLDRGFTPDEFEAVVSLRPGNLLDLLHRIEAVHAFRALPEATSLSEANKRIRNILRKSGQDRFGTPNPDLFREEQERALFQAIREAGHAVEPLLAKHDYTAALKHLATLKETVDAFFDHVMVMVDDPGVRNNRLGLLAATSALFLKIADISCLQG